MKRFERICVRNAAGYSPEGVLQATKQGLEWKADDESVAISRAEVQSLTWTPLHVNFQLSVGKVDGGVVNFTGLRHEAYEKLRGLDMGDIKQEEFSTKGQNWGKLSVVGKTVVFSGEGERPIFKVPLPDVSTLQYGKDDVTFEFGGGSARDDQDVLVGMSFHIPNENEDFPRAPANAVGAEEEVPELREPAASSKEELPAKRFFKMISPHIDAAGKSERPIGTFDEVTSLVPRGRFEVQLHHSYLKMLGQAQDFKIKYNSILHLFVLPKPNPSMTVVAMRLDPPIRKGQTFYDHVLFQFETDAHMSLELNLAQDEMDAKNREYGGSLRKEMASMVFDVFAACIRGLSGAGLIRPKYFANFAGDGACVRCSYKNDEGFLFPLERTFFYIHKPPLCITHDDIDSVEFQRQGTNVVTASVKTFDLCIRTHQGTEHQFRGIQRNEWQGLFKFISSKNLTVENVESVRQGPAQHVSSLPLDDMDLDMPRHSRDDSEESDPDFNMKTHEEEEGLDSSESGGSSSGAEIVDEAELSDPEPMEEAVAGDDALPEDLLPSQSPKKRAKARNEAEGGDKKKRKKKDKNAPKKNLSAFMFFSQAVNESVRQEHPGVAFGEIGKIIGERWKALGEEEKKEYQGMAQKDKVRYQEEKAKYEASAAAAAAAATRPSPDE